MGVGVRVVLAVCWGICWLGARRLPLSVGGWEDDGGFGIMPKGGCVALLAEGNKRAGAVFLDSFTRSL